MQMNLQLPLVVSDITGGTGLRILRDIVAGDRDAHHLAQHRDRRCHATPAEIVAALTGNYRPEHVFVLQQNLELFDALHRQLAACGHWEKNLALERSAEERAGCRSHRSPQRRGLASYSPFARHIRGISRVYLYDPTRRRNVTDG